MGVVRFALGVCLGTCACTSAPPKAKPAPAPSHAAPASQKAAEPAPDAVEAAPPELRLVVLEAHLALGLAVQNHSAEPQRLASRVWLVGEGREVALPLTQAAECLTLRPGAEWLWPADWQRSLAPDQRPLRGLRGEYHFEAKGCEGGQRLRSDSVSLPLPTTSSEPSQPPWAWLWPRPAHELVREISLPFLLTPNRDHHAPRWCDWGSVGVDQAVRHRMLPRGRP